MPRNHPSLGWCRSWKKLNVWTTHNAYKPARVNVSPIPRAVQELDNGAVWTTLTTNLPMSRCHPSLGWCRSWINGTVWNNDYRPAHIKASPIPRLAQELNVHVWDSLNHNDYQPAHIKVSPIPRLVHGLDKWNTLNHNDYQPAHVKVSSIPRLVPGTV